MALSKYQIKVEHTPNHFNHNAFIVGLHIKNKYISPIATFVVERKIADKEKKMKQLKIISNLLKDFIERKFSDKELDEFVDILNKSTSTARYLNFYTTIGKTLKKKGWTYSKHVVDDS